MTLGLPLVLSLLGLSCLALIGLAISGVLVSRAQKRREKRRARLAAVARPALVRQLRPQTAFTPPPRPKRSVTTQLAQLFGFDPARPDLDPAPWWVVLFVTLVLARLAASVLQEMVGSVAMAGVPVIWVLMSRAVFGRTLRRRQEKLLLQFPDALMTIVRSVGVGISVMEAVNNVAREAPHPTGPAFARFAEQIAIGKSLDQAVLDLAGHAGIPEYRFFATALILQNQTGGSLSTTLEGLAEVIRRRLGLKARGHALSSEARASANVLAALPIVVGLLIFFVNHRYFMVLVDDPTGRHILFGACISLALGMLSMRAIIRRTLS